MARHQLHRGPAPGDDRLFADRQLPSLRAAASDVCWLLDRGYALRSSVELVGNRYSLGVRQRMAVSRCVCSREDAEHRAGLMIPPEGLGGKELWIDGYNVLTVLESALAGGIVLLGRDGCCRDIAGIHRRYRKMKETLPVLDLMGNMIAAFGVSCCRWWLDKPVSNSGRLKTLILDSAASAGWNMSVDLVFSPDHILSHTEHPIATSDSIVLNRCKRWVNLSRSIIEAHIPEAKIVDLSLPASVETC